MAFDFSSGVRTVGSAPTLLGQIDGINITELAGIIGFNRVPPDHNGAVGQDHVVSVLNHVMQIYDKSGNLLSTQTLDSLFGVVPGAFVLPVDPNILYDPYTERFVYVSFEVTGIDGSGSNPFNDVIHLNVAVSQTSNPLDGWHVQSIDATTEIDGENTWSDYPGIAVDGEAIYISANMFQFDPGADGQVSFAGNRLWIVDKGDGDSGLYDGGGISFTQHDPVAAAGGGAFNATLMPVRYANDSPGGPGVFLVSASGATNGANEILQVFHVTDPLGTPDFSVQQISLGDISNENLNFLPGATQPGTVQTIGSGDARINSGAAVWFEGKIYLTFSTAPKSGPDAGQTTTHWVELDATSPAAISLLQQGNIGGEDIGPGVHTYHSSINVNKDGSVLINFSASGPTVFPGAYYALRGADDPTGEFGPAQTLSPGLDYYFRNRAGEGISSQTINRWGDFSGVGVDPVDGTTFWFFNQYADFRGSPNPSGQDGRWTVTLGSARPTIQNFQFDADSPDESFYGGIGADALQLNAKSGDTRVDISQNIDGSLNAVFSDAGSGIARAYFIEALLFLGADGADTLYIDGTFATENLDATAFIADGGAGADFFSGENLGSALQVQFWGGTGNDTLIGGLSKDSLSGGFGNDTLDGLGDNDVLKGENGFDSLLGGDGDDLVMGDGGNDRLNGGNDNDTVSGGFGFDRLEGAGGNDLVQGNSGNDTLRGASGDDTLEGGDGVDVIFGGQGSDIGNGGAGNDRIRPEAGNDTVRGGADDDRIFGSFGFDLLIGESGADLLNGDGGNDTLEGGSGNDTLFGGFGFDILNGGLGFDTLAGSTGNDTVTGGTGDDVFQFALGDGNDVYTDFTAGATTDDVIELSGFGTSFDEFSEVFAAASQQGSNVVIDFGAGDAITLLNTTLANLHEDDFIFGAV